MSTAGPNICGTGASSGGGSVAWSNPTDIQADDTSWAVVSFPGAGYSNYLKASHFGFAIPSGATITNISFSFARKASLTSRITEYLVKLLNTSGLTDGNNVGSGAFWTSPEAVTTVSGDATYWGVTLTPALVNDVDFGLAIEVSAASGVAVTASVDYVSCTVTYTVPGGRARTCFMDF